MLGICWASIEDGGPALTHHWIQAGIHDQHDILLIMFIILRLNIGQCHSCKVAYGQLTFFVCLVSYFTVEKLYSVDQGLIVNDLL